LASTTEVELVAAKNGGGSWYLNGDLTYGLWIIEDIGLRLDALQAGIHGSDPLNIHFNACILYDIIHLK
jgi:hypothetical protein